MSRAGDPDTGGPRSSRQGSARSISTADRVAAVTRETCFRFGRRPWAFGWVSRLLQVLFVVQLAGLSIDPSLDWSELFRWWSGNTLGYLSMPSAAVVATGSPDAILASFWVALAVLLLLLACFAALAAAVFSGAPTPGAVLHTGRIVLRTIAIPFLPSLVATMVSPLRCAYDGDAVVLNSAGYFVGPLGSANVFSDTPALEQSMGVSLYPISGPSVLSLAASSSATVSTAEQSTSSTLETASGPLQCWAPGSPLLAAAVSSVMFTPLLVAVLVLATVVPFTTSPMVYDAFASAAPTSVLAAYSCISLVILAQALLPSLRFWQHLAQTGFALYGAWVVLRRFPFTWTSTNLAVGSALATMAWTGFIGFAVDQLELRGTNRSNTELAGAIGFVVVPLIASITAYLCATRRVAKVLDMSAVVGEDELVDATHRRTSHYILHKAHSRMQMDKTTSAAGIGPVSLNRMPSTRRRGSLQSHPSSGSQLYPGASPRQSVVMGKFSAIASGSAVGSRSAAVAGDTVARSLSLDEVEHVSEDSGDDPILSKLRGPEKKEQEQTSDNSQLGRAPSKLANLGRVPTVDDEVLFDQPWVAELAARWVMQPEMAKAAVSLGMLVATGAIATTSDAEMQQGRAGEARSNQQASGLIGGTTGFRGTVGASGMALAISDGADETESLADVESAPLALRLGVQAVAKAVGEAAIHKAEAVWDAATEEYPRNAGLWIAYAGWLSEVVGDYSRATAVVSAAARLELGWLDRLSLYVVERRMLHSRKGGSHAANSGLDLAGYVEFTRQMRFALRAHRRVLVRIRAFWRTVQVIKDRRRVVLRTRAHNALRSVLFATKLSRRLMQVSVQAKARRQQRASIASHAGDGEVTPRAQRLANGAARKVAPSEDGVNQSLLSGALRSSGAVDSQTEHHSATVTSIGPGASASGINHSLAGTGDHPAQPHTAKDKAEASASVRLPLKRLSRQCALVDEDAKAAEAIYRALIERYPSNTKVLRAAARFLTDVQLAQTEGQRYIDEAEKIETEGAEEEDGAADGLGGGAGAGELNITSAVDDATDALVVINSKGIILSANSNTRRMFGRSEAELVGRNVSVLMPPMYAHQHDRFISRYLSTGQAHILGSARRVEGLHRDGYTFPIEIAINRVDTPQGITFAGVIHQVPEDEASALLTLSRKGIVVTCNRTFARQFGWSIRAVTGKSVRRFMPRKDQRRYESTARRAGAAGQATSLAAAWKNGLSKHGMCFPIAVEASMEGDGSAALIRCKITELANAHGVLTMDAKGTVQSCNSALLALFGFSGTADIVGRAVTNLMPEPYATFHQSYIDRFLSTGTGRIVGGEGRYVTGKRMDGQPIDIFLRVSAVRDAKGKRLFAGNIELASKHLAGITSAGAEDGADAAGAIATVSGEGAAADDSDPLLGRVTINEKGIMQFVNRQVVAMFGYKIERDLLGKNIKMLTPPDIAKMHDSFLEHRVNGGEARVIGTPGRHMLAQHADGHLFPVSLNVEEERVGSHRVFHGTLRTLADMEALLVADFHGKILEANEAVGSLLGHKVTTLVGQNLKKIMPKRFAKNHDGYLKRYRQTGQVRFTGKRQVVPALHSDGTEVTVQAEIAKVTHAKWGECLAARLGAAPMSAHEAEVLVQSRIKEIDVRRETESAATPSIAPGDDVQISAAASHADVAEMSESDQDDVSTPHRSGRSSARGRCAFAPSAATTTAQAETDGPVSATGVHSGGSSTSGAAQDAATPATSVQGGSSRHSRTGGHAASVAAGSDHSTNHTVVSAASDAAAAGSVRSGSVAGSTAVAGAGARTPDHAESVIADATELVDDQKPAPGPPLDATSTGGSAISRSPEASSRTGAMARSPGAAAGVDLTATHGGTDRTDATSKSQSAEVHDGLATVKPEKSDSSKPDDGHLKPGPVPMLAPDGLLVNPAIIFSTENGDMPDLGPMNANIAQELAGLGPLPEAMKHIAPDPALYHSDDISGRPSAGPNARPDLFTKKAGVKSQAHSRQDAEPPKEQHRKLSKPPHPGSRPSSSTKQPPPMHPASSSGAGADSGIMRGGRCIYAVQAEEAAAQAQADHTGGQSDGIALASPNIHQSRHVKPFGDALPNSHGGGASNVPRLANPGTGQMGMQASFDSTHQHQHQHEAGMQGADNESLDESFLAEPGAGGGDDDDKSEVSDGSNMAPDGARKSHRQRLKQLRRVKRAQVIRKSVAALRFAFRSSVAMFALLLAVEFATTLSQLQSISSRQSYLTGSAERATSVHQLPLFARRLQVAAAANDSTAVVSARTGLWAHADRVRELGVGLEVGLGGSFTLGSPSSEALAVYSGAVHTLTYSHTSATPGYTEAEVALFDAANFVAQAGVLLAPGTQVAASSSSSSSATSTSSSTTGNTASPSPAAASSSGTSESHSGILPSEAIPENLQFNPNWRYIMDNSITIGSALMAASQAETVATTTAVGRLQALAVSCAIVLTVLPLVGALWIVAPALERLDEDRQSMFRTFFMLPSTMVSKLATKGIRIGQTSAKDVDDDAGTMDGGMDDDDDDGDDDDDSVVTDEGDDEDDADSTGAGRSGASGAIGLLLPPGAAGSNAPLDDNTSAVTSATASKRGIPARLEGASNSNACSCCGFSQHTTHRSGRKQSCWRLRRVFAHGRLLVFALVVPVLVQSVMVSLLALSRNTADAVNLADVAGMQLSLLVRVHHWAQELVLSRSVATNGTTLGLPPLAPEPVLQDTASFRALLSDDAAMLVVLQNTMLFGYGREGCGSDLCKWGATWRRVENDGSAVGMNSPLAIPSYELPSRSVYPFQSANHTSFGSNGGTLRPRTSFTPAAAARDASHGVLALSQPVSDLLLQRQCTAGASACVDATHRLFVSANTGLDALLRSAALQASKLAADANLDLATQNGRFAMLAWMLERDLAVGFEAVKVALIGFTASEVSTMYAVRSVLFAVQLISLVFGYQAIFGPIISRVNMETARVATFLSFLPARVDIRKLMGASLPASVLRSRVEGDSGGRA